ncbi:HipA domain-containing protein [Bathymodiolus japonicus methanotrophic gill symbiont]|uniref:HipA domain-containing protein n=1 Tax=Bathymodiolus japonicus methanotrophic gill symbiont TaxID=113269 RepID=UPI001C8D1891|nr:HipA domain-containing protein [Bathymodiolus japonicus methanotrophic gill symbiont]
MDKQQLFERIALSLILGDGDDTHLKIFSIIYSDPGAYKTLKWSPVYDIVHTRSYNLADTPVLKFMDKKRFPTRALLELFAKRHAIKNARQIIERINESAIDALNEYNEKNNAIVHAIRKQL